MADSMVRELILTPPLEGVQDGLDPSLDDAIYSPAAASDLENIRISAGKIQTRRGSVLWKTLGGSGDVRMLAHHYELDGTRIRLAARGSGAAAILYDYVEGTDTAFASTSGGTGLGGNAEPYFMGVTMNDAFYFVDRAGALRKYQETPTSGDQVRAVALPTRPSAAPVATPRTYDTLEDWNGNGGVAPFGWTVADTAKFDIEDGTATTENPLGGRTVLLNTKTNPKNSPIREDTTGEDLETNQLFMYLQATDLPTQIVFQYGFTTNADFTESLAPLVANDFYPLFLDVAGLNEINYKRFVVLVNTGAADTYVSKILECGRLQGQYRWRYTHYDPTLVRESEPSDATSVLDFSAIGVTNDKSTLAALKKSCGLTFTSDSGSDSTTTKIRIYRNGGVPSLTKDRNGNDVWLRVGEVFDQSTTISGNPAAGATSFSVASATNLATGDWLVLAKGTVSSNGEEIVHVTNVSGTTITIYPGLSYAHTNGQAVQIAFVDNVANASVDVTAYIDVDRDDPPSGAKFILRIPDGRLILANWTGKPTGIALSNRATPERPTDYEVFPDNVDPMTRRSIRQGFRTEIGGDATDEAISGAVVFNDRPYFFTKRHLYAMNATSQVDWGPYAIVKVLDVGCVAPDTVQEVNGVLYWVAEGPRIMRWDGQNAPEDVSFRRVNERLKAAAPTLYKEWRAVYHAREEGAYYRLFYATQTLGPCDINIGPVSATTCETASNLLAWYKADDLALADGAQVSSWTDASGNGRHMARAVSAEQPIYASDSVPGGGPIVRFTSASKGLTIAGFSNSRASYTFYFVYRNTPDSPSTGNLMQAQSAGGGFTVKPDRSTESTLRWTISGSTAIESPAVCGWQCVTVVADNTGGFMYLYRNGTLLASGAYAAGVQTDSAWTLGAATGFSNGVIFDLAECQLYDAAHDASTIAAKSTCLRSRWSLAAVQGSGG